MPQREAAITSVAEKHQRGQHAISVVLLTTKTIFTPPATAGLNQRKEIILRGAQEIIIRPAQEIITTHKIHNNLTTKGSKRAKQQLTKKCNSLLADNADSLIFLIIIIYFEI
jgi:uncharacterized membrane protein